MDDELTLIYGGGGIHLPKCLFKKEITRLIATMGNKKKKNKESDKGERVLSRR